MTQLSLWDVPATKQTKSQVKLVRADDKGWDVLHILSGKFVCRFRPGIVSKAEAQIFCDMLASVDIDSWWSKGCPEDGTPRMVGEVSMTWRRNAYPGFPYHSPTR